MWFFSQKVQNKEARQLQYVNRKILQIWQCRQCLNIIYQNEYVFSPFSKDSNQSYSKICLENVKIEIGSSSNSQQKFMKIGYNNKRIHIKNQVKMYCKLCTKIQQLGELRPEVDLKTVQFHYELVPKFQNIKKTKIIYGRIIKPQIQKQHQSIQLPKIFPKNLYTYSRPMKRLSIISKQIEKYLILWVYSKNFIKIYYPFILQSQKKRKRIQYMKQFISKLMLKEGNIKIKLSNVLKGVNNNKQKKIVGTEKKQIVFSEMQI